MPEGGITFTKIRTFTKRITIAVVLFVLIAYVASYYSISGFIVTPQSTANNKSEHTDRTPIREFAKRREQVKDICTSVNVAPGEVTGVFTDDQSGVIYCFAPKAGCTFWKRVFKFVNHEVADNNITSPFDIPRFVVHTSTNASGNKYSKLEHHPHKYPTRFIVARDPMSRIIASYLDKIYLPDFWQSLGSVFLNSIRGIRQAQEYKGQQFDESDIFSNHTTFMFTDNITTDAGIFQDNHRQNATTHAPRDFWREHFDKISMMFPVPEPPQKYSQFNKSSCSKYITFSEFVTVSLYYPEPHWTPVSQLCDPCQFLPSHVLRVETFSADAQVILSQMGLGHLMDSFDSVAQVNEELTMLVDYHFTVAFNSINEPFYRSCLTTRELAFRLWNNFCWRGYIHPQVEYVVPPYTDVDHVKADLKSQIWKARELGLRQPEVMKRTKKEFEQYLVSTLSDNVLEELTWKFRLDYDMFGYDRINIEARNAGHWKD